MPTALLIAIAAGLAGWSAPRAKKRKPLSALLYAGGALVVTQAVLPRVGVQLPARIG